MERNPIELWISPEQEKKWTKDAQSYSITLYEYIRRAVDAYYSLVHQYDKKK